MKTIARFSVLLLLLLACKREKADFIGPGYVSAPEGFAVTNFTAAPASVDFTAVINNKVIYNATFTQSVTWILTIKGVSSGAEHVIRGTSNGLTNVEWSGVHDGLIFFRRGEYVTSTLSFYGNSYTITSNLVYIVNPPDYTTCGQFLPWGDFETPSQVLSGAYWHAFNNGPPPTPNVTQGVDSIAVDYKGNKVYPVQGRNYYFIKGLGKEANYVSGVSYDTDSPLMPVLPSDPDRVWVNIYLWGTGDANAQVELEYQEVDGDGDFPHYQGTDDDAFVAKVILDHYGWKLFSFKYSTLVPSLNADFGGSGNKIHEPHKLESWDAVLVKRTIPTSPVELYFDYPIITVDGPFKPCK